MSQRVLTSEEMRARAKKAARAEKARVKKWIATHPRWSELSTNQQRNMRRRLRNRR